ncbi:aminotransferase class III-fold pyridoxal phosphate-dependent enzyme [Streptosporangium sp. NPDC051022]|uniref:aminotransferase family protein n=1 Tax=Streptosporangium sp. NPDC051022 TaxID=3155752 RepID=UPI00341DDDAF
MDAAVSVSMTSGAVAERDDAHVWHPWSPVGPSSGLMIARAEGYRLWDVDGREYVDGASGAMNCSCGHGRAELVAAVGDQLRTLAHVDLSFGAHEPSGRLAERLAGLLGHGLTRTFFANSGSEGIEAACRIALNHWSNRGEPRHRIVSFERGYHGSTALCQSLSGLPAALPDLPSAVPVARVALTDEPRALTDPAACDRLLGAWERALDEPGAGEVAAVVVEPLLNAGGGVVFHPSFLAGLRRLCDERGVLLVVDEVFTGFGRTGEMFGFRHSGITPDVVVMSKGITSGYVPLSAVTTTDEVYRGFASDPVYGGLRYGHTTSGHAAACAVALATLDVIERDELVANARDRGAELLRGLGGLAGHAGVVDVRGLGLTVVVECSSAGTAARLREEIGRHGVLLRQQMSSLLAVPPLVIDAAGVRELTSRVLGAFAVAGGHAG